MTSGLVGIGTRGAGGWAAATVFAGVGGGAATGARGAAEGGAAAAGAAGAAAPVLPFQTLGCFRGFSPAGAPSPAGVASAAAGASGVAGALACSSGGAAWVVEEPGAGGLPAARGGHGFGCFFVLSSGFCGVSGWSDIFVQN